MRADFERARMMLVRKGVVWASLVTRLQLVGDDEEGYPEFLRCSEPSPRACTDFKRIYFQREFEAECTREELMGVYMHEVMHNLYLHHKRKGLRDARVWGRAIDYEINGRILRDYGLELPEDRLDDKRFDGLAAEVIYQMLLEEGDQGEEQAWGGFVGGDLGDSSETSDSEASGTPRATASAKREWEAAGVQAEKLGAMLGAGKGDRLCSSDHASTASMIDWRDQLRVVLTKGGYDYGWEPGDRRGCAGLGVGGMLMPAEVSVEECGRVVFFLDTSGSMPQEAIRQAVGELREIQAVFRPQEIVFVGVDWGDVEEGNVRRFQAWEPVEAVEVRGGGGTSFEGGFKWIRDGMGSSERASGASTILSAVVYMTDGLGDFPGVELDPGVPVVWAHVGRYGNTIAPKFGAVCQVMV